MEGDQGMSKGISVVLRYDDFGYSDDEYDRRLLDLCQEYGVPIVVGVVPGRCSRSLLRELSRHDVVEAAMHGLFHVMRSPYGEVGGGREAWGLELGWFRSMLEDGVGRAVSTFIPPWNGLDTRYISCIAQAGFSIVSGGPRASDFGAFAEHPDLAFIPFSTGLETLIRVLRDGSRDETPKIAVALWHHYNMEISEVERVFKTLRTLSEPDVGVRLTTARAAAELTAGVSGFYDINATIQFGRDWIARQVDRTGSHGSRMRASWVAQQFLWLAEPAGGSKLLTRSDRLLLRGRLATREWIMRLRAQVGWAWRSRLPMK